MEDNVMGLTKSELVGAYRLLYGRIERTAGTIEYPYGEDATGYLLYLDHDRVSWHIMVADRRPFSNPDLLGGAPKRTTRLSGPPTATSASTSSRGTSSAIRH